MSSYMVSRELFRTQCLRCHLPPKIECIRIILTPPQGGRLEAAMRSAGGWRDRSAPTSPLVSLVNNLENLDLD